GISIGEPFDPAERTDATTGDLDIEPPGQGRQRPTNQHLRLSHEHFRHRPRYRTAAEPVRRPPGRHPRPDRINNLVLSYSPLTLRVRCGELGERVVVVAVARPSTRTIAPTVDDRPSW